MHRVFNLKFQTRVMPLGNLTKMTDEERNLVVDWVNQGAKI